MEGSYHGKKWTMWLMWKEGVKLSDIHHRLSAVHGKKVPACSTLFSWVQVFNSGRLNCIGGCQ